MPLELRKTTGSCPVCMETVPAVIIEEKGRIYIEKHCPKHGVGRALISVDPAYYKALSRYYFSLFRESLPQRDFILRLTARCNMDCPICLASANVYRETDLPRDEIRKLLATKKKIKLDLMGAEPTLREDLERIIEEAHEAGHITALHTNGIMLGKSGYLHKLVSAGLDEVHLQFDGFDEKHDILARGRPMNEVRQQAMEAAERENLAVDLVVTVIKGSNEAEMMKVLTYAASKEVVKEVFFLGCRPLGNALNNLDGGYLTPDETAQLFIETSDGLLNRDELRIFQKLYFAMLALFRVRKCFYIHHYLLFRGKNGKLHPVSERIDLEYLEPKLDRFPALHARSRILAGLYLGFHGSVAALRKHSLGLLTDGGKLALLLLAGFNLARIKRSTILLGFISACDPWIHDTSVAANCGKGELSTDVGYHDAGADANVAREKLHKSMSTTMRNAHSLEAESAGREGEKN